MASEGIDDMDYLEEFDLDPALAYSPDINEAMLEKVAEMNAASEKENK